MRKILLLFLTIVLLGSYAYAKEPENLHTAKQRAVFYHDSGEYDYDRELVVQDAIGYLQGRVDQNNSLEEPKKLAIVFDIDDTSLSNYAILKSLDFGFQAHTLVPLLEKADDPAIQPTLKLYRFAKESGVSIFFITARPEELRLITEANLKKVGFTEWVKIYLKPDKYDKKSVIPYKSSTRKSIEDEGYDIIVNIGDQWSDLAGGYSERVYKLPNPYYYIP